MFLKIKTLFLNLAIYGMGDVATHLVGFLLLPIFTRYLSGADYGILQILLTVGLIAKIAFRWGVDAAFMRFFYECPDDRSRQQLASTIFFFLLAANGAILAVATALAPLYADRLLKVPGYTGCLQLTLASTFISGFFFLPFHVFRIRGQSRQFSVLTFTRSAAVVLTRVILVVGLGFGVWGIVVAEFVVTLGFTGVLLRWFVPLIRPAFSCTVWRQVLRFGLPRVPHGIAQQVVGPTTDPILMQALMAGSPHTVLTTIGVYGIGSGFGLALKFFLSAFEYAWAPFYFATMKEPDARRTFSVVTTYGFAVLVLLAAGLSALSEDLVRLMVHRPEMYAAARVVPWIAVSVTLQGVYLLTSIGMNITKRVEFYPVATLAGAATNIASNVVLIPRLGLLGPAVSNVLSFAVLAGVAFAFSQRLYPIRYERGRLARIVVAGVAAYLVAVLLVPAVPVDAGDSPGWATTARILHGFVQGVVVVVLYAATLALTGFFRRQEAALIKTLVTRLMRGNPRSLQ